MQQYGTFIQGSACLGTLFIAGGHAEMNGKMASYTVDREVFIKTFCSFRGSYVAVKRNYFREFCIHVPPQRGTIYRTVKQFEGTGNVVVNVLKEVIVAHLYLRNISEQHGRQ
jgi:hypothetical protein